MRRIVLGLLLILAAGCQTPANEAKVKILPSTMVNYQKYLGLIGTKYPGAFAVGDFVGPNRKQSYGYSYCDEIDCTISSQHTYNFTALKFCRENQGRNCQIFAEGREIKVQYEIEP